MNLIPPLEIASKIMTLIQEADKRLIIVTPYVSITGWDKMKKCLQKAVDRGVEVLFIARENAKQDLSPLFEIGIEPILIADLHAKIYINDKYAIVSSMNLLQYSDNYSIDIGYVTQTSKERSELVEFVQRHITDIEPNRPLRINRTSSRDFDKKRPFSEFQVERIHKAFSKEYYKSDFVATSSYVFSGDLLPFADVMMDAYYTIKISKDRPDCDQILGAIGNINFRLLHQFKVELFTAHDKFYYLYLIPTSAIELQKLVEDYTSISKSILKSDIVKNMGKKTRKQWW